MNKVVRYTILPVWILAGLFVVTVAILIITPCAIYHCIKDAWLDWQDRNHEPPHATSGNGAPRSGTDPATDPHASISEAPSFDAPPGYRG